MRSIDMLCPPTEEVKNNSSEIEENTSALNKLIETIENKLVITEVKENYNDYNEDDDNEDDDNEDDESEGENENE